MWDTQCAFSKKIGRGYYACAAFVLLLLILLYVVQPRAVLSSLSRLGGADVTSSEDEAVTTSAGGSETTMTTADYKNETLEIDLKLNNGSFTEIKNKTSDFVEMLDVTHLVDYELPLNITKSNDLSPIYFCNRKLAKLSDPCLCYVDLINRTIDNRSIRCAMAFGASGRMGNVIGQYATLLVLSRLNGRPSFMTPEMGDVLTHYFQVTMPHLTGEWSQAIPWSGRNIHDWMEESYKEFPGLFIRLGGYPSSNTFFRGFEEDLRREFRVHDDVRERAETVLRKVSYGRNSTTFIGIHVRRGDYIRLMDGPYHGVLADRKYFLEATDYFRSKYDDAVFVVVSNGMEWCRENIPNDKKDVFYVGNNNEGDPITDFAILMNCNHSIITIGTYGFFAALFSGGDTVYFTNFTMPDSPWNGFFHYATAFPEQWHPIAADLTPLYAKLNETTTVPTTTVPTTTVPTTTIPSTTVPTTIVLTTTVPTTTVPSTAIPTTMYPTTAVPSTTVSTTAVPNTAVPSTTVPITTAATTSQRTTIPTTV